MYMVYRFDHVNEKNKKYSNRKVLVKKKSGGLGGEGNAAEMNCDFSFSFEMLCNWNHGSIHF